MELTIENGSALEKVTGVITDSDFTTSVEITTYDGNERLLDYSLIKGFQETKPLEEILKTLTEGTKIRFSYGDEQDREPTISGTVGENDGEESLEIITAGGKELVLNYAIIRSLLIHSGSKRVSAAAPVPPAPKPQQPVPPAPVKTALYQQTPDDLPNASDSRLKATFDVLPKADRQKLSSIYERYKYGVKVNDRSKMQEAANQARQILFYEDDRNYDWSCEAALLENLSVPRARFTSMPRTISTT